MLSLDTETPLTAQSSPKEQSVLDDDDVPMQSLCPCPFECGIEPCVITLMKHHIIVTILLVNLTKQIMMQSQQLRKTIL